MICSAWRRRGGSCWAGRASPPRVSPRRGPRQPSASNGRWSAAGARAPFGAHFTSCAPDYDRDEAFQREYAATARDDDAWNAFRHRYLDVDGHDEYLKAVGL